MGKPLCGNATGTDAAHSSIPFIQLSSMHWNPAIHAGAGDMAMASVLKEMKSPCILLWVWYTMNTLLRKRLCFMRN